MKHFNHLILIMSIVRFTIRINIDITSFIAGVFENNKWVLEKYLYFFELFKWNVCYNVFPCAIVHAEKILSMSLYVPIDSYSFDCIPI